MVTRTVRLFVGGGEEHRPDGVYTAANVPARFKGRRWSVVERDDPTSDAPTLADRVATAEGEIAAAETTLGQHGGRLDAAEGEITTLDGRVGTAEGELVTQDGRLDTAEASLTAHGGRLDTAEASIATESGRVDALEATEAASAAATAEMRAGIAQAGTLGELQEALVGTTTGAEARARPVA